jgi:guanylate kinase
MSEIAFIMGKSASGKDKIYKSLIEDEELGLKTVTMYTTRPMRAGEEEGVEYHFVSDAVADQMRLDKKIIEMRCYDTIYGQWRYFTADDGQIDLKSNNRYIIIGTLEAYDQFCSYYGKEHLLPIYIDVKDDIRLLRAIKREQKQMEPKYDEMCRRFLADSKDFSEENIMRSGITRRFENNGELEECIEQVKTVILSELD